MDIQRRQFFRLALAASASAVALSVGLPSSARYAVPPEVREAIHTWRSGWVIKLNGDTFSVIGPSGAATDWHLSRALTPEGEQ